MVGEKGKKGASVTSEEDICIVTRKADLRRRFLKTKRENRGDLAPMKMSLHTRVKARKTQGVTSHANLRKEKNEEEQRLAKKKVYRGGGKKKCSRKRDGFALVKRCGTEISRKGRGR